MNDAEKAVNPGPGLGGSLPPGPGLAPPGGGPPR